MAIEAIAAAVVKEIPTAIEATKQLAEKIAIQSTEIKQVEQLTSLNQMERKETFKIGDGINLDEDIRLKEEDAVSDLKEKIVDQTSDVSFSRPTDIEKIHDQNEITNAFNEYPSSYEERIQQTPSEGDRGIWMGDRGESLYVPSDTSMQELLSRYNAEGVQYENAMPDFSPFEEAKVQIDKMSPERYGENGNFEQADTKCAELWNFQGKDGKIDWTPRDVANWRSEHVYTWHECNDMKTCQLIPRDINSYFGHLGGVGECKKLNYNIGDLFDA